MREDVCPILFSEVDKVEAVLVVWDPEWTNFAADYYGGYYPYGYGYYPYSYGYTYPYSYYSCKFRQRSVSVPQCCFQAPYMALALFIADDPYAYSYGPTVVSFY
jgi:hypothetical protein